MRIEHVALYVNDLENTKKFFMKYFRAKSNDGYHNQKTGFCSYFLTFEDGARIEIMNIPEMADLPKKIAVSYTHLDVYKRQYQTRMLEDGFQLVWLLFLSAWGCATCA